MEKYVADCHNVYAGRLMKKPVCIIEARDTFGETLSDIRKNGGRRRDGSVLSDKELKALAKTNQNLAEGTFIRPMLFQISPDVVAEDLRYTNSSYRLEKREPLIETTDKFYIANAANLWGILRSLGYRERLTQADINKIYRTLICSQKIILNMMKKSNVITDHDGDLLCLGKGLPCSEYIIQELLIVSSRKHGDPSINEPNYEIMEKKR